MRPVAVTPAVPLQNALTWPPVDFRRRSHPAQSTRWPGSRTVKDSSGYSQKFRIQTVPSMKKTSPEVSTTFFAAVK